MLCPCCRNISIHAPPRGATRPVCLLVVVDNNFNSRPSARGDLSICPSTHVSVFQFTPLREGRLAMLGERADTRRISIHAPPRGATHGGGVLLVSLEMISIHAPPRGATKRHSTSWKRSLFQFTPLREGRLTQLCDTWTESEFQFTPLREGRLEPVHHAPHYEHDFNSRPSARGDGYIGQGDKSDLISIHAPPRGATRRRGRQRKQSPISIHAPPRGATAAGTDKGNTKLFQFTPLREGRRRLPKQARKTRNFNSRPSARGDLSGCR